MLNPSSSSPERDDAHVARHHPGLGFHDAVQVRDAGDRVDQPGRPVVAEVVFEDPPYRIDPFPGLPGRVVDGDQDLHPYGLLPEIDACFGKGLFVMLVQHEGRFLRQVGPEGRDDLAVAGVHDRRAARLVVPPVSVVDYAVANGDVLAANGLDLDLEQRHGIREAFGVRKPRHAVGTQRAAGHRLDHRRVHGIVVVLEPVTVLAIAGRGRPQHVRLVDVGPLHATDRQVFVQVLDRAEPLGAHVVGILRTHVPAWFDQAEYLAAIILDEHFRGIGKDGDGIMPDDADLCHAAMSFRVEGKSRVKRVVETTST